MIAQLVIAFYFIVCVGIILFNCFTEIISRYRSCVLKRREQRYCEEYRQLFLENITENKSKKKREKIFMALYLKRKADPEDPPSI